MFATMLDTCYALGSPADPMFRTYAVLSNNKSKQNDLLGLWLVEFVLVFLKVWLVPLVYKVSKCCSGMFHIWSKLVPEFYQKVKHIGPRVPQGMPTSVQWGSRKNAPL